MRELVRPGSPLGSWTKSRRVSVVQKAVPAFKDITVSASICTSINEVVVHGSSRNVVLNRFNYQCRYRGVCDGYCGDSAWTYPVGKIDPEVQLLLETTEAALCRDRTGPVGNRLSDISTLCSSVEADGFSVRDYVGHG